MSASSWWGMALAELRVSLLVALAIPNLCHGSAFCSARDEATHPANISSHMLQSVLGKFCLSSCRMKTIKAQFCSWSSQNIPHGFLGLKAVMCGKATLPGSCALEFRGKWGSSPFHLLPVLPLPFISMRWGLAVLELGSSFLKCNIYPVPLLSLHPQRQNWFSWCCCTFNVPFYVHVCSNRVATSTDDLNLYHPQTDNAGATSLSLSLLVYLI